VYPSEGGPWLQAFAGVVLREGRQSVGTLAVIHSKPYAFHDEDLDFIRAVAGLLGRALEIENLKYQLQVAKDSLALSTAVVQDSALESPVTGLPNGRFLDIWMQNHMPHARRQKETLCLALWEGGSVPTQTLQGIAKSLRSDDHMVELGRGRFLLLLPQTPQEGAKILLSRIHWELGKPALGATIWLSDRDDLMLRAAMARAEQARQEALLDASGICWKLATQLALD
jgi:GGDEF domain-containing protein